ncbi:MAG TPA: hypothetical protein P5250_08450 [Bacteroidales bacterium]|nr:hypothetical protein [Bacteroidales bacterium]
MKNSLLNPKTPCNNLLYNILTIIICISSINNIFAQGGVAINTTGAAADPSSQLDINASDKGILIPRLTTAQKNAITNPANGLIIYLTDSVTGLYYYDVNKWKLVGNNASDNLGNHTATQSLNMNNFNILNVASPTNINDAVNVQNIQEGSLVYANSSGSNNNYIINLSPAPTTYTTGMVINFKASFNNTGAVTVNVNGLGNIPVKKNYNNDLAAGDIKTNQLVSIMYDGNNFQMLSQLGNTTNSVTYENFVPVTCVGPKTSVTWGDFYPTAAAAGYLLKNCVPRKISGQSSDWGWVYLGMASSGCGGGSYAGTFSPSPSDTWTTTIYSYGSNMYWFIIYNKTVDILCFK